MRIAPDGSSRTMRLAVLVALVVLAGCATTVSGAGTGSKPAGASTSPDFPSGVTTSSAPSTSTAPGTSVEPLPTPTSAPTPTPTAGRDIIGVKYRVPTGWVRNSNYIEVIPLESSYLAKYLIPGSVTPGLDVISIVLYRLPAAHLVDTATQQVARIITYNRKRSVTVKRNLERTLVGGRLAFDESVVQPGDGSASEFRYATWFVFGGAHVVQISCQVASQVSVVATGCQRLLDSVTFS
ncbi:MAG: hypothetical protein ABR604_05890 [Jatrophihabitantaceae bacterium]